jgi:hypothetical protein
MDSGETFPLPMPDRYRREMLADWTGAGRAITGRYDVENWYERNRHKIRLHSETRVWLETTMFGAMLPETVTVQRSQ